MAKLICPCGFVAEGEREEVKQKTRGHAKEIHPGEMSEEEMEKVMEEKIEED